MANNIELITKYSEDAWDKVYKQESVTSLLDANPTLVRFTGAKTVKIGKIQLGGLNNYYRNNLGDDRLGHSDDGGFGYQTSSTRLVWEEFTLRWDRAATYPIEYFDNEEAGGDVVGTVVSEASRTVLVPEVDAACLSEIADHALASAIETGDYTADGAKPLAALNKAFLYFEEHEVPADDQIIFCSPAFMNALRNTSEVTKFLTQEDYNANKDIRFKIEKYEGRTLVTVSPQRLRTNIDLSDNHDGFAWGDGSKAINFLAVAKSAVMHIVKYQKIKVISGDLNLASQKFDGYTVFARIYHDVFVPDNKRVAIYLNTVESEDAAPAMELDVKVKDDKIKSITTVPGDVLCFVVTSSASSETVGSTMTGTYTIAKVGDAATSGTTYYAIDSNKKVLAKHTI